MSVTTRSSAQEFMIMLQHYLHSFFLPKFDWVQVDVTSCCNASCCYCPNTALRHRWINRHMTMETFKHLAPVFRNTRLVYLQGWGESLLNPFFFEMTESAKKAGSLVGTTTNGMTLDDRMIERIIRSGLDILSFSLANTDPSNDYVRQGAPVETVLDRIRKLAAAKKKAGTDKPAIHIAYVLLRSNKDDVKKLPSILKGLGISEVIISTLDYTPTPELRREAIFPQTEEEYENLSAYLSNVQAEGEQIGVPIHFQFGYAGRRRSFCSENIEKALVISATGDVMPCVSANLPVLSDQGQTGGPAETERLIFGNITKQPLEEIWWSESYKKFRRSFYQEHRTASCQHCPKLYLIHFGPVGVGATFGCYENIGVRLNS